jgi:asparagine synthase (glutamine-hydrolysing)
MTAVLSHRGPDADGFHVDGPLGLGHRRLAIIDLSDRSRQPMASADGRYVIVFNGEIYN